MEKMTITTFLLDPRVLDDCVSDSAKDMKIVGEVVAYRKPVISMPEYLFYVSNVDANMKPVIPPDILKLFHRKTEDKFNQKHLINLHYQRAKAIFLPYFSNSAVFLPVDFIGGDLVFCNGQFLKGNAETFKQYGISIL